MICPICKSEIDFSITIDATCCENCGTLIDVSTKEVIGNLICEDDSPSLYIPFEIDETKAREIITSKVKETEHVNPDLASGVAELNIRKVYAPAYLINSTSTLAMRGRGLLKENKHIMEHDFEALINMRLQNVPFICSKDILNYLAVRIEPFDFSKAVPFDGDDYEAPEMTSQKMQKRILNRLKDISNGIVKQDKLGYTQVEYMNSDALYQPSDIKINMVLLPLYITEFEGIQFVINGQTGEFGGDIPLDPKYEEYVETHMSYDNKRSVFYYILMVAMIFLVGALTVTIVYELTKMYIMEISGHKLLEDVSLAAALRLAEYSGARIKAFGIGLLFLLASLPVAARIIKFFTNKFFPEKPLPPETDYLVYLDPTTKLSVQRNEKLGYIKPDPEHSFMRKFTNWYWPT